MLCTWTSAPLNSKSPRGIRLADKVKILDPFLLKGMIKFLLKGKCLVAQNTTESRATDVEDSYNLPKLI